MICADIPPQLSPFYSSHSTVRTSLKPSPFAVSHCPTVGWAPLFVDRPICRFTQRGLTQSSGELLQEPQQLAAFLSSERL